MKKTVLLGAVLGVSAVCCGDVMDRPQGIKIGQRMTLRPYVSLSYTYDSNVDSGKHSEGNSSISVNPGFTLTYMGENWSLAAAANYSYHAYCGGYSENLNNSSWSESLTYNWSSAGAQADDLASGWTFSLSQHCSQSLSDDSMLDKNGRGIGRNNLNLGVDASLGRRINEHWHGSVNAGYYWLDYDNNVTEFAPMYGWSRWSVGAMAGYTLGRWTDLRLSGSYSGYNQNNNSPFTSTISSLNDVSKTSRGCTVHAGMGSQATEKISYSAMFGWSHFNYGDDAKKSDGFTYSLSGNWKITDRWQTMLLASAYYHPSDSSAGSSSRTDSISWGLGHSMVRGKLNATLDVAYNHNTHDSVLTDYDGDYTEDVLTGRFGLSYTINRFVGVYGNVSYQTRWCHGGSGGAGNDYDYDRFCLSCGLRFTY